MSARRSLDATRLRGQHPANVFALEIVAALLLLAAVSVYWLLPSQAAAAIVALGRAAARLKARTIDIPGFRIAYLEGGKGEPLVLLHGIGGDKDNWTYVSLFLTRRYRVIAWDAPGFGESSRPADAHYDVGNQVERLHAFLRKLEVTRAHFAGNSMGGLIASHYAVRYPDAVESLWLLDTAYVASAKPSEGFERIGRGEKVPLFAETAAEFDDVLDFVMSKPPIIPGPVKRILAAGQVANYSLNMQIFNELRATMVPLEETVKGLAIPTLIVWGDHDRVFDVSSAEILHRVMPRSQVVVMSGIGHVPMIEAPYGSARDYFRFRATLPSRRAASGARSASESSSGSAPTAA